MGEGLGGQHFVKAKCGVQTTHDIKHQPYNKGEELTLSQSRVSTPCVEVHLKGSTIGPSYRGGRHARHWHLLARNQSCSNLTPSNWCMGTN